MVHLQRLPKSVRIHHNTNGKSKKNRRHVGWTDRWETLYQVVWLLSRKNVSKYLYLHLSLILSAKSVIKQ